jgi:hypothetical protein
MRRSTPERSGLTAANPAPWVGRSLLQAASSTAIAALAAGALCAAQVITIDTSGKHPEATTVPVDRRYAQVQPTHVTLSDKELDPRTRADLIRTMQAEQGFAMRPIPRGHKGLLLHANGALEPAGLAYMKLTGDQGVSANPGDRVVITDLKFEHDRIIIDLNGGPDAKHRFLSHVQIGMGPDDTSPVTSDNSNGEEPAGSRLTLAFKDHVPEMTGADVKALLAPLISFDVKTPIQAFTDTLPVKLKDAIMNHEVWVGMSTQMVIYAKGQPLTKQREMDGQMPFEEWVYGKPPEAVYFVRINGNRVIRVEIAKPGEALEIFTKDEVAGLMLTDGTPVESAESNTHVVKMGDVDRDPNKEAPAAAPTLGAPDKGDWDGNQNREGAMKPVHFPKQTQPGANPDDQAPAETTPAAGNGSSSGTQGTATTGPSAPAQTQPGAQQSQGQSTPPQAPAASPPN